MRSNNVLSEDFLTRQFLIMVLLLRNKIQTCDPIKRTIPGFYIGSEEKFSQQKQEFNPWPNLTASREKQGWKQTPCDENKNYKWEAKQFLIITAEKKRSEIVNGNSLLSSSFIHENIFFVPAFRTRGKKRQKKEPEERGRESKVMNENKEKSQTKMKLTSRV